MCTVFPTNKTTHAIHPNEINRSTRNPSKRSRRGGACVPARTSAQRRFHTKNTRIVRGGMNDGCAPAGRLGRASAFPYKKYTHHARGIERWMRPCWATRAGTQAPPLPISIIIFHAIPHKHNNHLHAIHPNETNHLCAIPKTASTVHAQSTQTKP